MKGSGFKRSVKTLADLGRSRCQLSREPEPSSLKMPKRTDIKRVLVIGSGPIVIGQACEFDYSGTQACKALRDEGLEVVLVNTNPGDDHDRPRVRRPHLRRAAHPRVARAKIIERERPDAILPTVGGQTALNLAIGARRERRRSRSHGVELIGASVDAIKIAEDRLLFKEAMREIGLDVPSSGYAQAIDEALAASRSSAFRSSSGRRSRSAASAAASPTTSRSSARSSPRARPQPGPRGAGRGVGHRLEGVRARGDARRRDNFVVICSIENIDPMGVHTGDSITVAPALTLTDKEYQRMRDAARRIIRRVGVETGGSNIQFAINPRTAGSSSSR